MERVGERMEIDDGDGGSGSGEGTVAGGKTLPNLRLTLNGH